MGKSVRIETNGRLGESMDNRDGILLCALWCIPQSYSGLELDTDHRWHVLLDLSTACKNPEPALTLWLWEVRPHRKFYRRFLDSFSRMPSACNSFVRHLLLAHREALYESELA